MFWGRAFVMSWKCVVQENHQEGRCLKVELHTLKITDIYCLIHLPKNGVPRTSYENEFQVENMFWRRALLCHGNVVKGNNLEG